MTIQEGIQEGTGGQDRAEFREKLTGIFQERLEEGIREATERRTELEQDETSCLRGYHDGQTPTDVLEDWENRIGDLLDHPHGDDGGADHPVENALMDILGPICQAAGNIIAGRTDGTDGRLTDD